MLWSSWLSICFQQFKNYHRGERVSIKKFLMVLIAGGFRGITLETDPISRDRNTPTSRQPSVVPGATGTLPWQRSL